VVPTLSTRVRRGVRWGCVRNARHHPGPEEMLGGVRVLPACLQGARP
jgi:hypothetical protein